MVDGFRDQAGSYVPAFTVMLILSVIGAGITFLTPVPRRKAETAQVPIVAETVRARSGGRA